MLNYEDIKRANVINYSSDDCFTDASYYVRIDQIISENGCVEEFILKPHGMVVVVSIEDFNLNDTTIGYASIRTSYSSKGIMAINIGIIDNGYKGKLSSVLINYGKRDFILKKGDKFLRTTFQTFTKPAAQIGGDFDSDDEHYITKKKLEFADNLGSTFLSLNKITKEIGKRVLKKATTQTLILIAVLGVIITLGTILIGVAIPFINGKTEKQKVEKCKGENESNVLKLENKILMLEGRVFEVENRLDSTKGRSIKNDHNCKR